MSIIIRQKRPWPVQPQYNVGLQRSHPLARGLALKPLLFQHYEAVNPRFPAPSLPTSGNVSLRHGPLGPAVHFNGSQTTGNSWSYSTSTTSIFSGATSLAISCAFRITSLSAESTLAAVWGSTAVTDWQFLLTVSATGQIVFGPYQDGGHNTYIRATAASTISANRDYVVAVTWSPGSLLCSINGVTTAFTTDIFVAGTVNNINTGASTGSLQIGVKGDGNPLTGYIYDINFFVNARKNQDEINRLASNPWQIFRSSIVVPVKVSSATHTTTGAVTSAGATVAGSAAHYTKHTASGAVTGGGASAVGSATHKTLHTTTGAVTGGGAAVAGAALHPHTTTGAAAGGGASVAGTADVTTGASHSSSGATEGGGATVAGAATHRTLHTTSGATGGGGAAVAGAATHLTLHTATGDVQGGGATVAGAAELTSLNGGKSSYLRQWLMEYYEAEWAQKDPVLTDPPAVAPTPVAQAARTVTRRTVRAAVAEQKKPPPAPYRADPRAAVNDFIQKQTAAVARKARVAAAIDSQDLAALTRRQQQRSAEAEEAEDEEILLLAAVL